MTNHSNILLDQNEIDIISAFENNLENIFSTGTKVIVYPSEEDFVSLAIEIDSNFSLSEIISLSKMPFNYKYKTTKLSKTAILFQNAIYNLNESMATVFDIKEISIHFKNTSIHIHSIERNSILEELEFVIKDLIYHFEYYSTIMDQVPNEIHIPVIEDAITKKLFDKNNHEKRIEFKSPYSKFWGLYFDSMNEPLIYNLEKNNIIPGDLDLDLD